MDLYSFSVAYLHEKFKSDEICTKQTNGKLAMGKDFIIFGLGYVGKYNGKLIPGR